VVLVPVCKCKGCKEDKERHSGYQIEESQLECDIGHHFDYYKIGTENFCNSGTTFVSYTFLVIFFATEVSGYYFDRKVVQSIVIVSLGFLYKLQTSRVLHHRHVTILPHFVLPASLQYIFENFQGQVDDFLVARTVRSFDKHFQ
jgi:hypothetical protein